MKEYELIKSFTHLNQGELIMILIVLLFALAVAVLVFSKIIVSIPYYDESEKENQISKEGLKLYYEITNHSELDSASVDEVFNVFEDVIENIDYEV